MSRNIFRCCKKNPSFLVTYSVCLEEKEYFVCNDCIDLDCFKKHIVKKEPVQNNFSKNKTFKHSNEITEHNKQQINTSEQIEKTTEQNTRKTTVNDFRGEL
ncbi:MAG: hypothetical protein IH841_07075 [Thaumarchaeota archaeon]|nr:hypothetical protein [Nitrososphaerota archaeon]